MKSSGKLKMKKQKRCEMNKKACQKIIGKRLRKLRREHNVSSKQMANIMQVSLFTYWKFERGRGTIMVSHVIRVAIFFKKSLDYIVRE